MTNRYGPEERQLLETTAGRIYSNAVAHGSLPADDPRWGEGSEARPALDLLIDIGLLVLDETTNRLHPVDPSTIQPRVVVPLGQRGAELLSESARWSEAFGNLGQTFRRSPQAAQQSLTEMRGLGNINSFIQAAVGDARAEILTAQPYGRRRATTLAIAEERDIKALERGVKMRTLYQHTARHSPATREYVAEVLARGGEVRTLDEFFKRLIVIDRQVAIIPASESHDMAVAIHDRHVIGYLVDMFDRSWERARTFEVSANGADQDIASDVRAMTIRLLVEGHSDPASAKRLGVSTRTYAGYIASLKSEYSVQTRFQLGYAMGRDEIRHVVERLEEEESDESPLGLHRD